MSSDLFRKKYRIPSARATWHDYNGGAYFVTICTRDMVHYFGAIVGGEMNMTEIGKYVQQCMKNIPQHNTYANVPAFVVMPNHVHLIVIIDDENADSICRDVPCEVPPKSWTDYKNSSLNLTGLVLSLSFILSLL